MKDYLNILLIVIGVFGITFGQSGENWYHWGSFSAGIVVVVLFGIKLLDEN